MPAGIDWKAEDDKDWDEFKPESGRSSGGWRGPGRRLRLIVLAIGVAAAVTAVAIWQINRFLDSSTEDVEQELLDGHGLVMEAGARGDGDLARDLILDRLREWTDAQILLVEQGLMLDRRPFGLYLADGEAATAIETEVDPSLREAIVTVTMRYRLGAASNEADSVRLQQTFSYRFEDDRWLLNPPTGEFWGNRLTTSGRYLTLSYPEKDAEIGQRLAADLEVILGQACHVIDQMNCQEEVHLPVDLTVDPADLIALADPTWQLHEAPSLRLPTPSLVGLPEDEAAYRALYRGYAQRIVARQIAMQTKLSENERPLASLALLNLILRQLGLIAHSEDSARPMITGEEFTHALDDLWENEETLEEKLTSDEMEAAEAIVAFLADAWSEVPATEMLRLLALSGTAEEWLHRLNPDGPESGLAAAWERYVADTYPAIGPEVWPEEVILLMCEQGIIGSANLYRYSPAEAILSIVSSGHEFIHMEPLPDGEGVLLAEQAVRQDEQRTYLWSNGRLRSYETVASPADVSNVPRNQWAAQASTARQSRLTATSSDGSWVAELDDEILLLTKPGEGLRRVVPHGARECRGLAWVQVAVDLGNQ